MTEFKKGDPVVTAPGVTRSLVGTPFPERSTGVIDNVDRVDLGVVLDDVGFVALGFDQVERVPAPLDLSKVKAGDTVTLERDGGRLPGQEVMVVSESGTGYTTVILRGGLQVYITGPDAWTLTAHQPAPEPEWEPGTVATATTSDPHRGVNGAVLGLFVGDPENDTPVRFETYSGDTYPLAALSDVRPLVVIDPATVNAQMVYETVLPKVTHDLGGGSDYRVLTTVRHVLRHLGLAQS